MPNQPNDNHFHFIEEKRHREHMARREQARDDGTLTIEQGEAQLAAIRAAKVRAARDQYRAELAEVRRELAELLEGTPLPGSDRAKVVAFQNTLDGIN